MSHTPDIPASRQEIETFYDFASEWLIRTGHYSAGNPEAGEGILGIYRDGTAGSELVPIATHAPWYEHPFPSDLTSEVRRCVPKAAAELGIGQAFTLVFSGEHHKAMNMEQKPSERVTPCLGIVLVRPVVEGIRARAYQVLPGFGGVRHDIRLNGTPVADNEGLLPLISRRECQALGEVIGFCMKWFVDDLDISVNRP